MIVPGSHVIIPLDIAIEARQNTYAQIVTRSSFAIKGVTVLGGVIDSDYRGNIKVILQNNSKVPFQVTKAQRIAQMIINRIHTPAIKIVDNLNTTARNKNGFGSTETLDKQIPQNHPITALPLIDNTTFPNNHATAAVATLQPTIEFTSNLYDKELLAQSAGRHL